MFCPLDRATAAKDGSTVRADRWWVYQEGKGIVFYRSTPKSGHLAPQCNASEPVADTVRSRLYPWAILKHLPVVYAHVDADGRMSI